VARSVSCSEPGAGAPVYRVVLAGRGVVLSERARLARSWSGRLKGLLGRRALDPGEALWLVPCSSVHTIGMRFALDLVFLDDALHACRILEGVPPGRLRLGGRAARSVLELAAGTLGGLGLRVGEPLAFTAASDTRTSGSARRPSMENHG